MACKIREIPETKSRIIIDTLEGSVFYIVEGKIKVLIDIIQGIYQATKSKADENFHNQEKYSLNLLSSYNIPYPPYQKAQFPSFRSFFAAFTGCRLLTINGTITALSEEDVLQLFRVVIEHKFRGAKRGYKTVEDMAQAEYKKDLDRMKLDELSTFLSALDGSSKQAA